MEDFAESPKGVAAGLPSMTQPQQPRKIGKAGGDMEEDIDGDGIDISGDNGGGLIVSNCAIITNTSTNYLVPPGDMRFDSEGTNCGGRFGRRGRRRKS